MSVNLQTSGSESNLVTIGHLLTRFAEKGLTYRITSNPIEKSIVWTMTVPENISQVKNIWNVPKKHNVQIEKTILSSFFFL
jgi:hypothetical protein